MFFIQSCEATIFLFHRFIQFESIHNTSKKSNRIKISWVIQTDSSQVHTLQELALCNLCIDFYELITKKVLLLIQDLENNILSSVISDWPVSLMHTHKPSRWQKCTWNSVSIFQHRTKINDVTSSYSCTFIFLQTSHLSAFPLQILMSLGASMPLKALAYFATFLVPPY